MNLSGILLSLLRGKKTVAKFEAGGFNFRVVIMPGVNDPRQLDRERLDAALKEAARAALADMVKKDRIEVAGWGKE